METINRSFKYINKNKCIIACFSIGLLFLILLSNYGKFCDEFDVMTGSWLISKGWILYKDIFSHHMPFPYYFMAAFTALGVSSPLGLRLVFVAAVFSYFLFITFYFGKRMDKMVFALAFIIYAMTAFMFNGQMVLADSFFAMSTAIIFLEVYSNPDFKFSITDQIIISIATFVAITSTQIAVYPIAIFYIYYIACCIYSVAKDKQTGGAIISNLGFFGIVLVPFTFWFLYMMITDSFGNFVSNGLVFNLEYYSKFVDNDTPVTLVTNHIKSLPAYTWDIVRDLVSFENFAELSTSLFIAIMKASLVVFFTIQIRRKNYINALFFVLFAYFCNMRGGLFHGIPFYIVGIIMLAIMIVDYFKNVKITSLSKCNYLYLLTMWLIAITFLYNFSFFISTEVKVNETDDVIETIQSITSEDDTIWCAPLSPEIYFVTNRLPADGNIFYLPWQSAAPDTNQGIINNLLIKQPKIIYFEMRGDIWGYKLKEYGELIYSYIQENYFTLPTSRSIYYNNLYKDEIISHFSKNKTDVLNLKIDP